MRERQRQSGGAEDQSVLFFSCVGLVFFLQIFIRHNPKKERKKERKTNNYSISPKYYPIIYYIGY